MSVELESRVLEAARERLAERTLRVTGLLAPTALFSVHQGLFRTEALLAVGITLGCVALGVVRFPFHVRAGAILAATFGYSLLIGMPTLGIAPAPLCLLGIGCLYAALLYGSRAARLATTISVCGIAIYGTLFVLGKLAIDPSFYSVTDPANWMRSILTLAGAIVLPLPPIAGFIHEVTAAARSRAAALDATIEEEARRETALIAQRTAQRELRDAQRERSLGRMAGGLAHEINGVLQEIEGWIEIIETTTTDDPMGRGEALEEMRDGIRRAAAVGRRLLYVGGKNLPHQKYVRLDSFLRRTEATLVAAVGAKAKVSVEVDSVVTASVDKSELLHALVNLVVNARDAMSSANPGNIVVRLREPSVAETQEAEDCGAVIEVNDDGAGIPPEVLPKIFEPFFTTKGRRGSGLGLATVRRLIEGIHGRVLLESELGRGTRVRLLLPKGSALESGEETPYSEVLKPTRSLRFGSPGPEAPRLLFVEDQASIRSVFRRLVPRAGIEFREAENTDEALEILEHFSPDLIWSDAVMPGRPVQDLVARARELGIQIVVASGHLQDETLRRDLVTMNVEFVPKPYSAEKLIERAFEARSLAGRSETKAAPSQAAIASKVKAPSSPPAADSLTVLVADDDRSVRRSLKRGLERLGFVVIEAENGVEAESAFFSHHEIDVILLDMNMPIRGGVETALSILEKRPSANIVMCTGYGESGIPDLAGIKGVVTKPVSLKELSDTLRDAAHA